MLEFIGLITLCFIGYKILKVLLEKNKKINSYKYSLETRDFAVNELNIPSNYFNYITSSKMIDIKDMALSMQKIMYPNTTWPCLLAITIYMYFYNDLKKGNQIIDFLKIDKDLIKQELDSDPNQTVEFFVNSKNSYESYTDNEINKLLLAASKIPNKNIIHDSSLLERIDRYVDTADNFGWASYNEGDISFEVYDIDERGTSYFVSVQKIDKGNEKSASTLTVEKENTLS